jgi:putative DNA-invertase from lambdoid prophage Rac
MREYALRRGWQITTEIREIGSGALQRPKREELLAAARRRELTRSSSGASTVGAARFQI